MIEKITQNLQKTLEKKLPKTKHTKAVIGWFVKDETHVVPYGDFGTADPCTMSFQIGSITKLCTATISSILAKQGKIDISKCLGYYLELDEQSTVRTMIIEDILTHHSGLPSAPRKLLGTYDPSNPYTHVDKEKLLTYANNYRKKSKKTKTFSYSNIGYALIGLLLEEITGKTYEELVSV